MYLLEQSINGKPLVKTQNRKLTIFLILLSFVKSVACLCYATTAELCELTRHSQEHGHKRHEQPERHDVLPSVRADRVRAGPAQQGVQTAERADCRRVRSAHHAQRRVR